YEGLTVWINSLIAGAGGQIVNEEGDVVVNDSARRAAEIESKLANSAAAPPGMSTNAEDQARLGFESGRSDYQVNYPFVYPSAAEVSEEFQKNMGWARYPRSDANEPSRPPLGGINIGVSSYSETPDLAFEAAECIASEKNQAVAAELGGLPPTTESVYDTAKVKKAYPFADLLRESIEDAAPRPVTPAYSDISLAIQKTFHPPEAVDPNGIVTKLRDRIEKAAEGKIF
ncbi:MAG: extracellular solute-binding protein, partial [Pseudonocardiaceae bacterium]